MPRHSGGSLVFSDDHSQPKDKSYAVIEFSEGLPGKTAMTNKLDAVVTDATHPTSEIRPSRILSNNILRIICRLTGTVNSKHPVHFCLGLSAMMVIDNGPWIVHARHPGP